VKGATLVVERDEELETWPAAPDAVHEAFGALIVAIVEATADESPARRKAMVAALECQAQIINALRPVISPR
jgi:hypothetical protein